MSCINHRKPIPVHADRDGALRYAWLRAPPLRPIPEIPQTFATLDPEPHMRVGKGGHRNCSTKQGAGSAVPTRTDVPHRVFRVARRNICSATKATLGAAQRVRPPAGPMTSFAHPTE